MSDVVPLLVVTQREEVRAAVSRLAVAVGVPVRCAGEDAASQWRSARTVVVDADQCDRPELAGLPRHGDLLVVALGDPGEAAWRWAVRAGAGEVLSLPADESRLIQHLAGNRSAACARTVGVIGGCGGAGASTFATALALCAAGSRRTVLVDGDALGGGLDVLLGAEGTAGARWSDLAAARGSLPADGLLATLVTVEKLSLLSWGRSPRVAVPPEAVGAVLDALICGCELVVADLPRWRDPGFESLAVRADLAVAVVPATVAGAAAAAATLAGLPMGSQRVLVVRDPGRGQALRAEDVGGHLGLPVAAVVDSEPAVREAALRGERPLRRDRGSLAQACRSLLRRIETVAVAA